MINQLKKFPSYEKLSKNNRTVIEVILQELPSKNAGEINSLAKMLDKEPFSQLIHLSVFNIYTDGFVNQILRYLEAYLNYCEYGKIEKLIEFTESVR